MLRDAGAAEAAHARGSGARRRVASSTYARRDPRRRPRRRRPRRPRPQGGLHRPPAQALVRPVRAVEDPRAARRRRGARPPAPQRSPSRGRPPSSTATTGSTTAWSTRRPATSNAVLDWEICTLGDPLADLGLLMRLLGRARRRATPPCPAPPPPSTASRPGRAAWTRYAERSGRDVTDLDFYMAFGYWKLACILEGVYARYGGGAMGSGASRLRGASPSRSRLPRGQASRDAIEADEKADRMTPCTSCHEQPDARRAGAASWPSRAGSTPATPPDAASQLPARPADDTSPVATFDADDLLDHRARRPVMHLVDGVNTGLTWPAIELRARHRPRRQRRARCSLGAEPDHAWRAFTDAVVDLALDSDVRLVVGLGAYPAPVPHTRPDAAVGHRGAPPSWPRRPACCAARSTCPPACRPPSSATCAEVGLPAARPVGAGAPLRRRPCRTRRRGLALLEQAPAARRAHPARRTTSPRRPRATRNRLDVARRRQPRAPGHGQRQLEAQVDAQADRPGRPPTCPSGDELAAEVERFLRDQSPGESRRLTSDVAGSPRRDDLVGHVDRPRLGSGP